MADDTTELELDNPAIEEEELNADEPTNPDDDEAADAETEDGEEDEEGDGQEEEGEEEEETVEFVTVERNGKQYQVPKELEGEFLMQADYTKKTQATSARERELDEREKRVTQQTQLAEEEMQARVTLAGVSQQLDQYRQLTAQDWQRMKDDDPLGYTEHRTNFMQLENHRRDLANDLQQRETTRTQEAQQATAKRIEETRQFAETKIPGWTPEVDAKVTAFATSDLGFDRDTLLEAYNPQVYQTLYLAWLGHQTLNKPAAKPKPKVQDKPLTKVGGKANPAARKSLEDMSMDEYADYMNKREAQKTKR